MPRDAALLWHQPGKDGRAGRYIGILKLSSEGARAATGRGIWIAVSRRTGTTPDVAVLELATASTWSELGT
jgi:hypothetical protein